MKKNLDNKNRLRNVTVGFRMSRAESDELNTLVKLSGLTKQDYLINRSLKREVVVIGNPRVYKALRNHLQSILNELTRLESVNKECDELIELIFYISNILSKLKEDTNDK